MQLTRLSTSLLLIALSITLSISFISQYKMRSQDLLVLSNDVAAAYTKAKPVINTLSPVKAISVEKTTVEKPVPASSVSVWAEIGKQLTLDDNVDSPRVQAQLKGILANKAEFNKSLKSSAPYIFYIYSQIKARHLPAELALIPIIESDYDPYDHNSIGANGLWQLMPATAKGLGVKITDGYDGRRNVIDSTNAALTFFSDLGKEFKGNWYLAIAGYNCGDGGVSSAIRRANSHDYWQLPLPLETKIYVPRLLAIAEIIKNPQKYGIQLPDIPNSPFFTTIQVDKPISLQEYAKTSGISLPILQELNPEYKTTNLTPKISSTLLIPVQKQ